MTAVLGVAIAKVAGAPGPRRRDHKNRRRPPVHGWQPKDWVRLCELVLLTPGLALGRSEARWGALRRSTALCDALRHGWGVLG